MIKFRTIRADEIDLRVGTVAKNGYTLLLYKNARVDMAMLDETGCIWQRDHKEVKGNLYCGIGIYNEEIGQFVWKWDCGVESFSEKEKGEASDSFKRAGFNWGIGRELYTAPFIWIECENEAQNGKYTIPREEQKRINRMQVSELTVEEGKITKLIIKDGKSVVFTFPKNASDNNTKEGKNEPTPKPAPKFTHIGEPIIQPAGTRYPEGTAIAKVFDTLKTDYPDLMKRVHELEIEIVKLPVAFGISANDLSILDIQTAIDYKTNILKRGQ